MNFFLNPNGPMEMRKLTTAGQGGRKIQAITASSTTSTSAAGGQPVEPSFIIDLCKLRCMNLKLCTVKNKQY